MSKIHALAGALAILSMASAASIADAQPGYSGSTAERFRAEEQALQSESTNLPSSSPAVDRTEAPADPVPAARTPQEKRQRFATELRALQQESTSMPSASPRVDKGASAADPIPRATTRSQKAARFATEEAQMQRESTP
jgi:hypothetical protein